MKLKNNNELDIIGADGEVITVTISGSAGALVNNFVLNGAPWPGGSFKLDKTVGPIFKLLVQTIYKTTSGSTCEITITGSGPGGDVSVHDEVQGPGEAFDASIYKFTIT
jgi:hypothetical protein